MNASMENSPRQKSLLSPSCYRNSSTASNRPPTRPVTPNSYPTTFVLTDTSSFKQVVQMLTGSSKNPTNHSNPTHKPDPRPSYHSIPPIKAVHNKKQPSVRINERRNSMKHLKINPTHSGLPDIFSPSLLNFPSLRLSPVTPLTPDPFYQHVSLGKSPMGFGCGHNAEERGFYIHPSPSTTPRDREPRLLDLFPMTSPRMSDSLAPASTS